MLHRRRWLTALAFAATAACTTYTRAPWQEWAADGYVPPWTTFIILCGASQPRGTLAVSVTDTAITPDGWRPIAPGQILAEWPVELKGAARLIDSPERVQRRQEVGSYQFRDTLQQYGKAGDLLRPAFISGMPGWCIKQEIWLKPADTACYRDDDGDGRFDYLTGPFSQTDAHPFLLMNQRDAGIYGEEGEAGTPRYERVPDHRWPDAGLVRVQFVGPVPPSVAAATGEVQIAVGFSPTAERQGPIARFAAFDATGIARTDLVPGLPGLEIRRAGDRFEARFTGKPSGQIAYWNAVPPGGPDRDRDLLDRSLMLDFYPCAIDDKDNVFRVGPERSDKDPC